jgi:uncharacterized phage-associated protein
MNSQTNKGGISVFDVAESLLKLHGPMTTMKLQKLVYYCQAWALVWDEKPLFPEKILAWANGPVVRELFKHFQGEYEVSSTKTGDHNKLDGEQQATVVGVLNFYGKKSSQWLSDLTHMEAPWRDARKGLREDQRGDEEITLASLAEYYGSLHPAKQ